MPALYSTSIQSLPLLSKGKVRDVYAVGDDKLLMITTDRLSAFDVVMGQPIPAVSYTHLTLPTILRV